MKTNGRKNDGAESNGDAAESKDGTRKKGVDFRAEEFRVVGRPFR
jgi:hypothetical protein